MIVGVIDRHIWQSVLNAVAALVVQGFLHILVCILLTVSTMPRVHSTVVHCCFKSSLMQCFPVFYVNCTCFKTAQQPACCNHTKYLLIAVIYEIAIIEVITFSSIRSVKNE